MKQQVKLYNENTVLFEGRISDIPIRPEAIIGKSIELFDDEDPCVIHQSYVIKNYVDDILMRFDDRNSDRLDVAQEGFTFLDVPDSSGWLLEKLS